MSANVAQRKAHWVLAGLLLGQVVMMSYFARHPDSEQSVLRTWLMTPLSAVTQVADGIISTVTGWIAGYTDLRGARQENIELRERVEQLTGENNSLREKEAEYKVLRTQIALPQLASYTQIAANVVSRNPSLWFKRLIIDRGTADGVKLDMPVATGAGIVGRVIAVGPNFSTVQLITDKYAGAGAMLQNSREPGEVRGLGDEPYCELRSIPSTSVVEVGESVVTTGYDRIYPKGLLIGTVERLEPDPTATWHKIIIKPAAPVDRVEHVFVLLVEKKDLQVEELNR
ncbi:MAG TPA: rod shape-determining protein MreC [Blastocatellia bacterium]|jgi:rod shape-determining protein MreC